MAAAMAAPVSPSMTRFGCWKPWMSASGEYGIDFGQNTGTMS